MLRWSGLNRLVLLFCSTAHLREGERGKGEWAVVGGVAFPTPARGPCPWNHHRGYGTHQRARTGSAAQDAQTPRNAKFRRVSVAPGCPVTKQQLECLWYLWKRRTPAAVSVYPPIRLLVTGLRLRRGRRCATPYVRRGSALLP